MTPSEISQYVLIDYIAWIALFGLRPAELIGRKFT